MQVVSTPWPAIICPSSTKTALSRLCQLRNLEVNFHCPWGFFRLSAGSVVKGIFFKEREGYLDSILAGQNHRAVSGTDSQILVSRSVHALRCLCTVVQATKFSLSNLFGILGDGLVHDTQPEGCIQRRQNIWYFPVLEMKRLKKTYISRDYWDIKESEYGAECTIQPRVNSEEAMNMSWAGTANTTRDVFVYEVVSAAEWAGKVLRLAHVSTANV